MEPDEEKLQAWFTENANKGTIHAAIDNIEALGTAYRRLASAMTVGAVGSLSRKTRLPALRRALDICKLLEHAQLLGTTASIAQRGNSMYPDLLLITRDAHFVLVELKTKKGPERQCVQELLAYGAAIKLQAHVVTDIVYVIVAYRWDTLLEYAVRSLVIDGKQVLPLRCDQRSDCEFTLSVRVDLLDVVFDRPFDPMLALTPATLAIARPSRPANRIRGDELLTEYFRSVKQAIVADCERLHQSGFAMCWHNPSEGCDVLSLTVFTVNQHWRASEAAPADSAPLAYVPAAGLGRVQRNRFTSRFDEVRQEGAKAEAPAEGSGSLDDLFAHTQINEQAFEAAGLLYPQTDFSYQLLERYRRLDIENKITTAYRPGSGFELASGAHNLDHFFQAFTQCLPLGLMRIDQFNAFGDLDEFMAANSFTRPRFGDELHDALYAFHDHKVGG